MTKGSRSLLSLYSGAGGLDLGLEAAGFEVRGCAETDADAIATLGRNRSSWQLLEPSEVVALSKVVRPATGLKPGDLDLLAGGPPCQPFSKAGQWQLNRKSAREDVRARTIRGYFDIVEDLLPAAFLIENVGGFIRGGRAAIPLIERRLERINAKCGTSYKLSVAYVDSADFGVPQHRRRALVVGDRDGRELPWPSPTHAGSPITAWDALGESDQAPRELQATGTWAKLLPSIPPGQNYQWHTSRGGGVPLFGYRRRYWSFLLKLDPAKPSWTLSAQPGPATGPFHWDNRRLSIAELLRLQSMPSDWNVVGSRVSQVKQIGNATPPLLAEVVGRTIAKELFGVKPSGKLRYAIARRAGAPTVPGTRSVPEEYLHLSLNTSDHPGVGKGPAHRT